MTNKQISKQAAPGEEEWSHAAEEQEGSWCMDFRFIEKTVG